MRGGSAVPASQFVAMLAVKHSTTRLSRWEHTKRMTASTMGRVAGWPITAGLKLMHIRDKCQVGK